MALCHPTHTPFWQSAMWPAGESSFPQHPSPLANSRGTGRIPNLVIFFSNHFILWSHLLMLEIFCCNSCWNLFRECILYRKMKQNKILVSPLGLRKVFIRDNCHVQVAHKSSPLEHVKTATIMFVSFYCLAFFICRPSSSAFTGRKIQPVSSIAFLICKNTHDLSRTGD